MTHDFSEQSENQQKQMQQWPWASTRVLNAFRYLKIYTNQDVEDAWFQGDFKKVPNLGKKSIKEIQEAMGLPGAGEKKCHCCGAIL